MINIELSFINNMAQEKKQQFFIIYLLNVWT